MADVLTIDEIVELLNRFGMKVGVDLDGAAAEGVSPELVRARLAHTLVGVVEAHASRTDDAARRADADVSSSTGGSRRSAAPRRRRPDADERLRTRRGHLR